MSGGEEGRTSVGFARLNRQIMAITGGYLGAPEDFVSMDVALQVRAG
jgi:hypothetical protein